VKRVIAAVAMVSAAMTTRAVAAPTLSANKRAAHRDAARLLERLRLPLRAARSAVEPSGDGGLLKPLRALVATTAGADVHAWWIVPGAPDQVMAYVEAHPPAGSKLSATGGANNGQGRTGASDLFEWRPIRRVLGERHLMVSVTALSRGVSGVLVQAESIWIVPRPVSERVPKAARAIDVTSAKLRGPTTVMQTVTDAVEVRRIVTLIDSMPVVQPVFYHCPMLTPVRARVITLSFRDRAGGRALARATYTAYPPPLGPSGPCNPIQFTIGGRRQPALIGGEFMKSLQRILGISLITPKTGRDQ
jgi:hypothetical protein